MKIHHRFEGPTELGNGGYVAGRLAHYVDGAAEITFRRPIPLSRPMRVQKNKEGLVQLTDLGQTIAEAKPSVLNLAMPARPTYAQAVEAAADFVGFETHAFPKCFVCGPHRRAGDGLHVFAGPLGQTGIVAAPWVPHESLADDGGFVRPEFHWAALDCPGYFAAAQNRNGMVALLGRLNAKTCGRIEVGERCFVMAWSLGCDGRKHFAATALINESGDICGIARATWIELAEANSERQKQLVA